MRLFFFLAPTGNPVQKITSSCKEMLLELEAAAEDITSKECDDEGELL